MVCLFGVFSLFSFWQESTTSGLHPWCQQSTRAMRPSLSNKREWQLATLWILDVWYHIPSFLIFVIRLGVLSVVNLNIVGNSEFSVVKLSKDTPNFKFLVARLLWISLAAVACNDAIKASPVKIFMRLQLTSFNWRCRIKNNFQSDPFRSNP
jgi:hypothetical protein